MSSKRIPNLSVTDGFDFVKKIWGSLPIPSVMSPTTDLDELDKRISDLKAVEQWLNVNLSMLRATIQGLEVQRGTIATIKSFGSNLGLGDRQSDVNMAVNEEIIRNAMQAATSAATSAASMVPPIPRVKPVEVKAPEPEPEPAPEKPSAKDSAESSQLLSNATAWWGLLQDQFNKVAHAALSGSGLPGEAGDSAPTGKSAPAKSSARKTSTKAGADSKRSTPKKPTTSRTRSRT
ncbi:MAG: PhaM family polyhydroxyalkanoate granule multifunctional regulatory protein [Limnobacter sp.]|uniref:PhaM family polyhydroxyalkanoate granule multifunctional regulatory protein n=1 Tax=Limnobacter sp. TaxID=2003368 RepID=UPI003919D65E